MICYRCGQEADRDEYCPSCGTDLRVFQKALRISNNYYNDGLVKARVRNLSGAIWSLKKSLKFNKYNIDARNLLGLIYYEMGEAVDALSEWVISKNYQSKDNVAGEYLAKIQNSQGKLSDISQTIRKYNQALAYCQQGSLDLAIIQLKKVIALSPKLVKAHQLMALLLMEQGKYEQAKKSLRSAGRIDADNTLTLRYLKEINQLLREQNSSRKKKKQPDDDLISYRSGNETIIMPKRFREYSIGSTLVYIVMGLLVGVAATYFLIVPAIQKKAVDDAHQRLLSASDTITTDNQTIKGLEKKIEELNGQLDQAGVNSQKVEEKVDTYEQMLNAYVAYESKDMEKAGDIITKINRDYLSANAKAIFKDMEEKVNVEYVKMLFEKGKKEYNEGKYKDAVKDLLQVVQKEEDYEDGNAAYYLAQAYRQDGDVENATKYYQYIMDKHPYTNRAATAKRYVNEQNAQPDEPNEPNEPDEPNAQPDGE